jgi:hypothetical protein
MTIQTPVTLAAMISALPELRTIKLVNKCFTLPIEFLFNSIIHFTSIANLKHLVLDYKYL